MLDFKILHFFKVSGKLRNVDRNNVMVLWNPLARGRNIKANTDCSVLGNLMDELKSASNRNK